MSIVKPQTISEFENNFDIKAYFIANNQDFHIPTFNEKIYKEECMYCFKTPFEPGSYLGKI